MRISDWSSDVCSSDLGITSFSAMTTSSSGNRACTGHRMCSRCWNGAARKWVIPSRSGLTMAANFISRELDLWAYMKGVTLDFSRPGKPTDNAFIESLHGKRSDEHTSELQPLISNSH